MRFAFFRLRETFGRPGAVDALDEDRKVTFAIRLKRHSFAIGRPDGKTVSAIKRQPSNSARPGEVVNPDNGLPAIVAPEREVPAVARRSSVHVGTCRQFERCDDARPIGQRHLPDVAARTHGTRHVQQRSAIRDGHVRNSAAAAARAPNALQNRDCRAGRFQLAEIEWHCQHDTPDGVQQMTGRDVASVAAAVDRGLALA